MKKVIFLVMVSLLFVACEKGFKSYYSNEKLNKWFGNAIYEKNMMKIKETHGEYKIYVFENEDEVNKLREKLDKEMKMKGISYIDPQKDSATYSNLTSYTVYFTKMDSYVTPNDKIVIMIAETNANIDSYTFEEFKKYLSDIRVYLQDSLKK